MALIQVCLSPSLLVSTFSCPISYIKISSVCQSPFIIADHNSTSPVMARVGHVAGVKQSQSDNWVEVGEGWKLNQRSINFSRCCTYRSTQLSQPIGQPSLLSHFFFIFPLDKNTHTSYNVRYHPSFESRRSPAAQSPGRSWFVGRRQSLRVFPEEPRS
jgi:hypothetical protein